MTAMQPPQVRRAFLAMTEFCAVVSPRRHTLHGATITVITRDGYPVGACRRHARHVREHVASYGIERRGPRPVDLDHAGT